MILTPDTYLKTLDFLSDRMAHVSRITHKLFNLLGINHFVLSHVQHTNKNALASLHVNMGASTYWVEHGAPLPLALPNGFYLVSQFKNLFPGDLLITLREKYATDHILFYVQHNHDSTDMFSMGADPDNKFVLNNYINYSHDMRNFFVYFKQETKTLLQQALENSFEYDFSIKKQKELFPEEIQLINYNGFSTLSDIACALSKREFECLQLSSSFVSIKSIAKKLNLSPRTVEYYLLNTKNKLNCNSTHEMLDLYHAVNRGDSPPPSP